VTAAPGSPSTVARLRAVDWRTYGLPIALLVIVLVGTVSSPYFLVDTSRSGLDVIRWGNIIDILVRSSLSGILSIGMTYVILTGGIDLSVGAIVGIAGVSAATFGAFGPVAMLSAGLVTGLVVGLVNGFLVTYGRVVPFIATLATMTIARGLALTLTNSAPVRIEDPGYIALGAGRLFDAIPYMVIVAAVVTFVGWFGLAKTRFGREVYAVGGNPEASRLSGIPVKRTIFFVYVISGLCAGLAAILDSARTNTAQPSAGSGYELDAIAAVVVGGTSLFGGRGSIVGTIFGVLIIQTISNIFVLLNVPFNAQLVVKGVIILAAVMLQRRAGDEG
jgi:ribose/xylose/arabinose/galactoside ABC-type transport system permease subunit